MGGGRLALFFIKHCELHNLVYSTCHCKHSISIHHSLIFIHAKFNMPYNQIGVRLVFLIVVFFSPCATRDLVFPLFNYAHLIQVCLV